MRKLIIGFLVGVLAFYAYGKYRDNRAASRAAASRAIETQSAPVEYPEPTPTTYHCDGRVYCSQMTSCEEATWFLQNCPGTKMDGEGDGVPCEKQWCGDH
jgi:hypothetical protein